MRRGVAIAVAAVVALLFAAPASAGSDPVKEIVVYDQDPTQPLVTFNRMSCSVKRTNDGRKFKAKGKSDGWVLDVRANDFSGFRKDYIIEYGIRRTNFTLTPPGTKSFYSNFFFPGDQPPPAGGALAFGRRGKTMGLGFIAAFFSSSDDQAVGIVGHAKCR